MARRHEDGSPKSKLVLRDSALGRSGIPRLEVRPEDFVELARELCADAGASGTPGPALRPEHLMALSTQEGDRELSLLLDSCAGDARVEIVARWRREQEVELPRPSVIWPSLRKLESEIAELHGVRWMDGNSLEAWPGGPVLQFLSSVEAVAMKTGGTA